MTTVSKSKFKSRALALFREVRRSGKPIIITNRCNSVLTLSPYAEVKCRMLSAFWKRDVQAPETAWLFEQSGQPARLRYFQTTPHQRAFPLRRYFGVTLNSPPGFASAIIHTAPSGPIATSRMR